MTYSYGFFTLLVPYLVPLPAYLLLTFSALLQTFVFMILAYVYLAGAVLMARRALKF